MRGFAACTEEELAWLYVDPEHMRRGIGRGLVEFLWQGSRAYARWRCWWETHPPGLCMKRRDSA